MHTETWQNAQLVFLSLSPHMTITVWQWRLEIHWNKSMMLPHLEYYVQFWLPHFKERITENGIASNFHPFNFTAQKQTEPRRWKWLWNKSEKRKFSLFFTTRSSQELFLSWQPLSDRKSSSLLLLSSHGHRNYVKAHAISSSSLSMPWPGRWITRLTKQPHVNWLSFLSLQPFLLPTSSRQGDDFPSYKAPGKCLVMKPYSWGLPTPTVSYVW